MTDDWVLGGEGASRDASQRTAGRHRRLERAGRLESPHVFRRFDQLESQRFDGRQQIRAIEARIQLVEAGFGPLDEIRDQLAQRSVVETAEKRRHEG